MSYRMDIVIRISITVFQFNFIYLNISRAVASNLALRTSSVKLFMIVQVLDRKLSVHMCKQI